VSDKEHYLGIKINPTNLEFVKELLSHFSQITLLEVNDEDPSIVQMVSENNYLLSILAILLRDGNLITDEWHQLQSTETDNGESPFDEFVFTLTHAGPESRNFLVLVSSGLDGILGIAPEGNVEYPESTTLEKYCTEILLRHSAEITWQDIHSLLLSFAREVATFVQERNLQQDVDQPMAAVMSFLKNWKKYPSIPLEIKYVFQQAVDDTINKPGSELAKQLRVIFE
jgi:hypothetical protein